MIRSIRLVIISLCASIAILIPAAPAGAQTTIVSCTGEATETYDPPLTNEEKPTDIAFEAGFDSCTDVLHGQVTGASITHEAPDVPIQCFSEVDPLLESTLTINWAGAEEPSQVAARTTTASFIGTLRTVVVTGTVTDGSFTGGTISLTVSFTDVDTGLCGSEGIPRMEGTAVLGLLSL